MRFRMISGGEIPPEVVAFIRVFIGQTKLSVNEALEVPAPEKFMKNFVQISENAVFADSNIGVGRWSYSMMHGPFAVLAFENLAKTLLKDGESIVGVDEVQFRQLMKNGLKMFAWNEGEEGADDRGNPPQVYGTFRVKGEDDAERRIIFKGYKGDVSYLPIDPALRDFPYGEVTESLCTDELFEVELDDSGLSKRSFVTDALRRERIEAFEKQGVSSTYELGTTMDLALTACSVLRSACGAEFGPRLTTFLCAGFRDLEIVPMGRFAEELTFSFVLKPVSKVTSSNHNLRDAEFEFKSASGERVGSGVVTIAYSNEK